MTKILVTGMSGTGKSSALAELAGRGYRTVETAELGWTVWAEAPNEPGGGEWLWNEDRISELLASDDPRTLFVVGCVRNQTKFYERFDAIVLLSAPADVILDRIERRTTNPYGKAPAQRKEILHNLATVEPALRNECTHEVDATRPLDEVVAELVAIANSL